MDDVDVSAGKNPPLTGSQHNIDSGLRKLMRVDSLMDVVRTRLGTGYNIST